MADGDQLLALARAWRAGDPDDETRAELDDLVERATRDDPVALEDLSERFAGRLTFGTAGLRAALGAGPMRMNRVVVRQAAAALARWLGEGRTVVIGFDARHRSDVFALDTARVLVAAGLQARLFASTCPTPTLAFAVRHLGADAGVMCTASHNPRHDNGYKVYLGDGAQIIPPVDAEIAAAIEQAAAGPIPLSEPDDPGITRLGTHLVADYLDHVAEVVGAAPPTPRLPRVAYTPLHGVAGEVAVAALRRAGFTDLHVVGEQFTPDPEFPTVDFPNPEEPGALDEVAALAQRVGADLVLAHDPDGDRLGAMVREPERAGSPGAPAPYRLLTGNEIGAILGDHVLAATAGDDRLVVTTIVSSQLLRRQAEAAGVHYAEVPTGFKWVVRPGMDDPDLRFVFGFEEALGYSVDSYVRDKDGISAGTALALAVARLQTEGLTVVDALDGLARRFGAYVTRSVSWRAEGAAGRARIAESMAALRAAPPARLADVAVTSFSDVAASSEHPGTDLVAVGLEDGSRICFRPSGTEPKLKVYVEVVEPVPDDPSGYATAQARGHRRLDRLVGELAPSWASGATRPATR